MSTQIPLVIVAALVAGGAGAFATRALTPAPESQSKAAPAALDPSGDLETNVAQLVRQQSDILTRLKELETRSAMLSASSGSVRVPAGDGVSEIDIDALISAKLAELASTPSGAIVTPEFRNMVDSVMEMRAEEEELAAEQRRAEREMQQLESRLARMKDELGLDPTQVDGMRKVFTDANDRRDDLGRQMREARDTGVTMDRDVMRETWQAFNEETNTALQSVLTPAQYEQYQESNQNAFGRGRGGFGGGGGDVGGGGRGRGRGN